MAIFKAIRLKLIEYMRVGMRKDMYKNINHENQSDGTA